MTEPPFTAKDVEEAFGKVDFKKLIGDDILKKSSEGWRVGNEEGYDDGCFQATGGN